MKKPLRTIQVLADWFDDYTAKRQDRMLRHFYAPKVAEKAKDWDPYQQLLSEWNFESDTVLHPVYARKAERLAGKARKYGISVPRRPSSYSE
jgi:hypothetical protein